MPLNRSCPVHREELVRHHDRSSQYASNNILMRPAEAGIEPFVGSIGESDIGPLAENIDGHCKSQHYSPAWSMPTLGRRRTRNARIGRRAQSSTADGAYR